MGELLGDLSKYRVEEDDLLVDAFDAAVMVVDKVDYCESSPEHALNSFGKYEAVWEVNEAVSPYCKMALVIFRDLRDAWEKHKSYKKNTPSLRKELNKNRSKTYREIVARDGEKCATCGVTENLCIDHFVPLSRGGTNIIGNLRLLCRTCNSIKSDKMPAGGRV